MFKKGNKKTPPSDGIEERGVRRCERNNSADTKVCEKGGGQEVLETSEQRLFPCRS